MIENEKKEPLKFKFDSHIDKKEDIAINNKENIFFIFVLLISFQFLSNFFYHPTSINVAPEVKMISTPKQNNLENSIWQQAFVTQFPQFLYSPKYVNNLDSIKGGFTPEAFEKFKNYTTTSIYYKNLISSKATEADIKVGNPAYVKTTIVDNQEYYTYYVPIVAITDKVYNINQTITFTKDVDIPNKLIISDILIEDNAALDKRISI